MFRCALGRAQWLTHGLVRCSVCVSASSRTLFNARASKYRLTTWQRVRMCIHYTARFQSERCADSLVRVRTGYDSPARLRLDECKIHCALGKKCVDSDDIVRVSTSLTWCVFVAFRFWLQSALSIVGGKICIQLMDGKGYQEHSSRYTQNTSDCTV